MEIGIGLDPTLRLSWGEQREVAQEAVKLGYQSAWTPAGATSRDAFHVCARWALATTRALGTGISVVPVAHWTVPQLAASAATVGELNDGKFALGVGTGGAYVEGSMRAFGLPAYPPIDAHARLSVRWCLHTADRHSERCATQIKSSRGDT